MSNTNRVSILYLTADNADADVVGSLVGIVREVQGGGSVERLVTATAPAPEAQNESPPRALPAPRKYKARAPKVAKPAPATTDGKGSKGAAVLAAMATGAPIDRNKLAKQIYGDSSANSLTKLGLAIGYAVRHGRARKNADGTFTVIG